ncbi:MAG: hypothetical protein WBV73_26100 [Phormidium sp.]
MSIGVITNAAIGALAFLYLKITPPTYTSELAIIVPVEGASMRIDLPDLGQTLADSQLPPNKYLQSVDPRKNYQYIATSPSVLSAAAATVKMSVKDFGTPVVTLSKDTAIMEFQLSGKTAAEAQQKTEAFYQALLRQINSLTAETLKERDRKTQSTLVTAEAKLQTAQKRLSEFKNNSILGSSEQVQNLSVNLELLRRQQVEVLAELQETTNKLRQMSADVGLSVQQASEAFDLQADELFKQQLKKYTESSTALLDLQSRFRLDHPAVITERERQAAIKAALMKRSSSLLGKPVDEQTIQRLNLSIADRQLGGRETLFRDLIAVQAERQGLKGKAETLTQKITVLESRFKILSKEQVTMDRLTRDVQVAETIFSSTVAKLDLSQNSTSIAYPEIQKLGEASLPEEPSSPNFKIVLVVAAGCSFIFTSGLILFWLDKQQRLNIFSFFTESDANSTNSTNKSER